MAQTIKYTPKKLGGEFGVSCVFPTIASIVEYEEGTRKPIQGYPRFIEHPLVFEIKNRHASPGKETFVVQSFSAAIHVVKHFFRKELRNNTVIGEYASRTGDHYGILYVDNDFADEARKRITSAGIILSARKAARLLQRKVPPKASTSLGKMLSSLEVGSDKELTFLYTCGMAAIYSTVSSYLEPGKETLVIGNTYTDTDSIFHHFPIKNSCLPTKFIDHFTPNAITKDTGIVYLEVPSNPLLVVEDVQAIVKSAHQAGAIVIIDSTIASPFHFNPMEYGADVVIHSTTKSLSGKNNHMGGVLFIHPKKAFLKDKLVYAPFKMDAEETLVLENNLADFDQRIPAMASNAAQVASYLTAHDQIEQVFYTKELKNGDGHLISFILKDETKERAALFYDNCSIPSKGPSMGYEKTMMMPYCLMTMYGIEEEELKKKGLSRYLMRLSIGTEDADTIIEHLKTGLAKLSQN